jgi:rhodanese-related sulfurtransferase
MKKILNTVMVVAVIAFFASCTSVNGEAEKGLTIYEDSKAMVADAKTHITEITPEDLNKLFNSEEIFLVIDVRLENEFNKGYIPGSVLMPRGVLEFRIASEKAWDNEGMYPPEKEEQIILYCKKGDRGALAAQTLKQMGYMNVTSLQGGFKAWKAAYPADVEKIEVADMEIGTASGAEEDSGGC